MAVCQADGRLLVRKSLKLHALASDIAARASVFPLVDDKSLLKLDALQYWGLVVFKIARGREGGRWLRWASAFLPAQEAARTDMPRCA